MQRGIPDAPPEGTVVVVGGANLDLVGHPHDPLIPADSNPGHVVTSAGGVGHNIAENLARLGIRTVLLTVFGDDVNGRMLAEEAAASGIDVSHALVADVPGSLYLAILDAEGDLALALSDMRAVDRLTPQMLEERRSVLRAADIVVFDTNLPEASIDWLARETTAPLAVDPVSVAKALRVRERLARADLLKSNRLEAAALLGAGARPEDDAAELGQALLDRGAGRVLVTLGGEGVWFGDAAGSGRLPAPAVAVVNVTGAGDAFTAGAVAGRLAGLRTREIAAMGSAVAGLALRSDRTVSESITWSDASAEAEELIA